MGGHTETELLIGLIERSYQHRKVGSVDLLMVTTSIDSGATRVEKCELLTQLVDRSLRHGGKVLAVDVTC